MAQSSFPNSDYDFLLKIIMVGDSGKVVAVEFAVERRGLNREERSGKERVAQVLRPRPPVLPLLHSLILFSLCCIGCRTMAHGSGLVPCLRESLGREASGQRQSARQRPNSSPSSLTSTCSLRCRHFPLPCACHLSSPSTSGLLWCLVTLNSHSLTQRRSQSSSAPSLPRPMQRLHRASS